MPKEDAEAKLRDLEKKLAEGWNNLHVLNESKMEAVRDVVREGWTQEQSRSAERRERAAQSKSKSKAQKQTKTKRLDHSKDDGMSQ